MVPTGKLVVLADLMKLEPEDAVALPVTIDIAAGKTGIDGEFLVDACIRNESLRMYLAHFIREAMKKRRNE